MQLIEAFVHNPVKVAVGVLLFALFGFIGLLRMPMQLTPEVQIPTITITTTWLGAAPQEIEREIIQEQDQQTIEPSRIVDYPDDPLNSLFPIKFFFGIPLNNSKGKPIGVLCALNDTPMRNVHLLEPIFSIFASRAAAELERQIT